MFKFHISPRISERGCWCVGPGGRWRWRGAETDVGMTRDIRMCKGRSDKVSDFRRKSSSVGRTFRFHLAVNFQHSLLFPGDSENPLLRAQIPVWTPRGAQAPRRASFHSVLHTQLTPSEERPETCANPRPQCPVSGLSSCQSWARF